MMRWPTSILLAASVVLLSGAAQAFAAELPAEARISSGFAVYLPSVDGKAELSVAGDGHPLVQGLAVDEKAVDAARTTIAAAGRYGEVSVRSVPSLTQLPYVSNLVTLLVVDADALAAKAPSPEECLRVVHPGGTVWTRRDGKWTSATKPMPKQYGEWTHMYGGADNDMRSLDAAVGAPTGLQWLSGPACMAEGAVSNGLRIGGGLAVHDMHFVPLRDGVQLIEGRNAFNGLPVFQTPLAGRVYKTRPLVLGDGKVFTYLSEGDVSADGKTHGNPGALVALDAHTGAIVKTYDKARPSNWYQHGRNDMPGNNLIFAAGALYQTAGDRVEALNATSGDLLWSWTSEKDFGAVDLPSYCDDSGLLVVGEGRWQRRPGRVTKMNAANIVALDAKTGAKRWSVALGDSGRPKWTEDGCKPISQIACAGERAYVFRGSDIGDESVYLAAIDCAAGKMLWNHEGRNTGPGRKDKGSPEDTYDVGGQRTDMTVIGNRIYLMSHGVTIIDAEKGTELATYSFGNSRCDASHAAANLLELGFGNFIDLASPQPKVLRTEIVRGHCATGTFPAYGMTYGTPSRCRCAEVLHGYMALSSDPIDKPLPDNERLMKGPAFAATVSGATPSGPNPSKAAPTATDWPTFMGTPSRSSAVRESLKTNLKPQWEATIAKPASGKDYPLAAEWRLSSVYNGPVTAPVVAEGQLFVAVPFEHRVEARSLSAPDKPLWSFTADGRIDTPPTIDGGLCLFGCHDGCVYCLSADTGALRWKFLAAPTRRQFVAYGQAESLWPIYGAVTVAQNTVVAIAGYHPETDGGMTVYGLAPATGAVRYKHQIERDRRWLPASGKADEPSYAGARASGGYNSTSIMNALTVSDGKVVSIPGFRFDAATGAPTTDVRSSAGKPGKGKAEPEPLPGAVNEPMAFSLVFNETSPERCPLYETFAGPGHHGGTWDFKLGEAGFATPAARVAWLDHSVLMIDTEGWHYGQTLSLYDADKGEPRKNKPQWTEELKGEKKARVALAIASNIAVVAERALGDQLNDLAAKSHLELRNLADGKVVQSIDMPAPPIFQGLAIANGRLFVTCVDGVVRCFGE